MDWFEYLRYDEWGMLEQKMLKVIDLEMGAEILGGDQKMAKDMLTMLVGTLEESRTHLVLAYQDKRYDQLEFVVHKLHGGAAYCGVPQLKEAAKQLENILKSQQLDQVDTAFLELIQALQNLMDAFACLNES